MPAESEGTDCVESGHWDPLREVKEVGYVVERECMGFVEGGDSFGVPRVG